MCVCVHVCMCDACVVHVCVCVCVPVWHVYEEQVFKINCIGNILNYNDNTVKINSTHLSDFKSL